MLIPIMRDHFRDGYAPVIEHGQPPVFFPNCNLAIRRKAFDACGGYDESLKATEDVDICRRVALSGWLLFFEPAAKCVHASRRNITGLVRQWFTYGYWSAFALKKNKAKKGEIFLSLSARPRLNRYLRLLATDRSPVPIMLFLSYFPIIHLLGIGFLLSLWAGWQWPTVLMGTMFACIILGLNLSNPALQGVGFRARIDYWCMTYLINASCTLGTLFGGLRNGMFYLYPGL